MKPKPQFFKYVDYEIPSSEVEKARPVAIAGLPTGGGGEGGPIHLDETDWVIATGEVEVMPDWIVPMEVFIANNGTVNMRVNLGTPEEPHWTEGGSPYVPVQPQYDEGVRVICYGGVIEESQPGFPTLYQNRVGIESRVANPGSFRVDVGSKPSEDWDNWSRLEVNPLSASLTTGLAEGSLPLGVYSQRYTVEVRTGTRPGIYAYDHPSDINPHPDENPYIGGRESSIITLAALRKYVEDTIGYGEPGQVLATNSTGDGYEWVDPQ